MSQTALAEAIGVSCQQVQKYERGIDRVSASRLFRICAVLAVDIREMFEDASMIDHGHLPTNSRAPLSR
jgi:transcriptional regulator with XRE-family HTH domain